MKLYKNNTLLSDKINKADNFIKRLVGLLNKCELNDDEGVLFEGCNSIHSIGMRFDFDAIFLDKTNCVIELKEAIKPNRILPIILKSDKVLEFRSGFAKDKKILIGDKLELK